MTEHAPPPKTALSTPRQIRLERTYQGSLADVWDLWTTPAGIESWWGPDGFSVSVRSLELRVGGELHYAMTAIAPPQIEFMKRAGMPVTTEALITYREIVPQRLLRYAHRADFIPGVAPYDVGTLLELEDTADGIRLVLTIDAMHDEEWTARAVMGWENELGKLARVLERSSRVDGPGPGG